MQSYYDARDSGCEDDTEPWCFCLSAWQASDCPYRLLVVRLLLFILVVAIFFFSLGRFIYLGIHRFWLLYFSNWGLLLILFTTGLSVVISAFDYVFGYEYEESLPWYMELFWTLYNIANPVTYMISVFYWTVLYRAEETEKVDALLDIATHVLNSLVMVVMLATSMVPSRMRHVYQPLAFSSLYVVFTIGYYLAGGVDACGRRYLYSVLNWSRPLRTIVITSCVALLLVILHALTVILATVRDAVAKNFNTSSEDDELAINIADILSCRQMWYL